MIKKLISLGLQFDAPDYIQRRIVPVNVMALILLFGIAIPFALLTWIFVPTLLFFPIAGVVTCFAVLIANSLGGIKYSRFFLATLPVYEINLYNAYLSSPTEAPMPGPFLIGLGFVMVIFSVFDPKEKLAIFFCFLSGAFCMIGWPFFRNVLNLDLESYTELTYYYVDSLRYGWLSYVMVILGVVVATGNMMGLSSISKKAINESEEARKDAEKQSKEVNKQKKVLEENMGKLQEAQSEESRRNWASQGLSQAADILRINKDSKEIYDDVISMIVKYTGSNQGGLFIVDRNDETDEVILKLQTCYAYSRKKFIEKEFSPGQGLIGQAFLEENHIYMTKVPENYVAITSGLGEATPSSVLIMPFKVNDVVEGILEIASFNELKEHEIEFLDRLGENIASFIQSNRINERTNKLLTEAKERAEEMQAQEEEMRQNMEELSATQEEMGRKETEYQKMIEDLQNENTILKEESSSKTDAKITDIPVDSASEKSEASASKVSTQ